jgi:long-chain fatty acid transport protein
VSVGLQLLYFKAALNPGIPSGVPPLNAIPTRLKGDSWGVGFNAGILAKPWDGTEIGFGYRSQVREDLSGSFRIPLLAYSSGAALRITTPDVLTVGLRQRITSDVTLLAGFEYDIWHLGVVPVGDGLGGPLVPPGAPGAVTIPFNFNNGWVASLGGEYKWNSSLTLRAGVAYEGSPVNNANRQPELPDSNRIWASVGASYKWNDKLSFDLGYSHLFGENGTINATSSPLGLTLQATTKAHVDIVSAGLTYRYGGASTPVIAKY